MRTLHKIFFVLVSSLFLTQGAYSADISQEYKYQVLVKETVNGIDYRDAIYYTPSQWESLMQADVNAEITKRTDNFRDALENPAPPYEPTKKELEDQKKELESQIAYLDGEIAKK